jgi:hypothetical protein
VKRIVAIDHEGDNIALDYETIEEAHEAAVSGDWLRVYGDGKRDAIRGLINPGYVYAITEDDS